MTTVLDEECKDDPSPEDRPAGLLAILATLAPLAEDFLPIDDPIPGGDVA